MPILFPSLHYLHSPFSVVIFFSCWYFSSASSLCSVTTSFSPLLFLCGRFSLTASILVPCRHYSLGYYFAALACTMPLPFPLLLCSALHGGHCSQYIFFSLLLFVHIHSTGYLILPLTHSEDYLPYCYFTIHSQLLSLFWCNGSRYFKSHPYLLSFHYLCRLSITCKKWALTFPTYIRKYIIFCCLHVAFNQVLTPKRTLLYSHRRRILYIFFPSFPFLFFYRQSAIFT